MIEDSAPTLATPRGSRWGADGLYYPAEEERTVPLSGAARRLIFYLYSALRQVLYPRNPQAYVAADQFIYYQPHDPTKRIAPDVWVCFNVPKEPERAVFRMWEEGATPSFVVEVSSKQSRAEDRGPKLALYRDVLRSREFLVYDEDRDELILYRLEDEAYQKVMPDPLGRLYSQELGVSFAREPGILVRIFDAGGAPLPTVEETTEHAEILERIRQRLEEEAAEMAALAERERRRADELAERAAAERARGEELAAANAQLRAELERLRQSPRE